MERDKLNELINFLKNKNCIWSMHGEVDQFSIEVGFTEEGFEPLFIKKFSNFGTALETLEDHYNMQLKLNKEI